MSSKIRMILPRIWTPGWLYLPGGKSKEGSSGRAKVSGRNRQGCKDASGWSCGFKKKPKWM